jgi:phage shock protein E
MRKFLSTIMILFLSIPVLANQFQIFEKDVQVIDVRSDAEWKNDHHPDAQHLPHTAILDGSGFAELDKTKPVVLYCRTGGRAEQAKTYLAAQGFTNVKNLGGISNLIISKEENQ